MANISSNYNPLENTHLFWDTKASDLDLKKDKNFIISRLLEEGDIIDTKWLIREYSMDEIIGTITTTKLISRKTANFFKLIFHITKPILCLTPSFQKTQRELWMR